MKKVQVIFDLESELRANSLINLEKFVMVLLPPVHKSSMHALCRDATIVLWLQVAE